jgi:hypothetical protein
MMKKKPWSFSAGEYRNTVTVYERKPGGPIYVRVRSPRDSTSYIRKSLGHSDHERAKIYALEQSAKLIQGEADILAERITLAEVFELYKRNHLPERGPQGQAADSWPR